MDEYLKVNEVAKRLKVSRKTISRYIKAGKLKAFYIGNQYRIFESSLNALVVKTTKKGSDLDE
jgi:excisionase family DNA binding protein